MDVQANNADNMEARAESLENSKWPTEASGSDVSRVLNVVYRRDIEQLFHDGFKIKDIRQRMIDMHNIKASEKMYKDRCRNWGLRRNKKRNEVKAMIQKHSDRHQIDRDTIFEIHGKMYSIKTLGPYWKRRVRSLELELMEECPSTLPDLSCLTLPPVPIDEPDELKNHHRMLSSIRVYCFGNFESGIWFEDDMGRCQTTLQPTTCPYMLLGDKLNAAWNFAQAGISNKAHKILQTAMPLIDDSITNQCPFIIMSLIEYMDDGGMRRNPIFHKIYCNVLARLALAAEAPPWKNHPLRFIFNYLLKDEPKSDDICGIIHQCLVDAFSEKIGIAGYTKVNMISHYNTMRVASDERKALTAQQELVTLCERTHGKGDFSTFRARTTLAKCFDRLQRYEEAEIQQLRAITEFDIQSNPHAVGRYCNELGNLAACHERNGKINMAEKNYRDVVTHCSVLLGRAHSRTFKALMRLLGFLRQCGRLDEAGVVSAQITKLLDEHDRTEVSLIQNESEQQESFTDYSVKEILFFDLTNAYSFPRCLNGEVYNSYLDPADFGWAITSTHIPPQVSSDREGVYGWFT